VGAKRIDARGFLAKREVRCPSQGHLAGHGKERE